MAERSYRVTLVPLPGGAPPIARLKLALKVLLRHYRFRASAVEEVDPTSHQPATEGKAS